MPGSVLWWNTISGAPRILFDCSKTLKLASLCNLNALRPTPPRILLLYDKWTPCLNHSWFMMYSIFCGMVLSLQTPVSQNSALMCLTKLVTCPAHPHYSCAHSKAPKCLPTSGSPGQTETPLHIPWCSTLVVVLQRAGMLQPLPLQTCCITYWLGMQTLATQTMDANTTTLFVCRHVQCK